VGGSNVKRILFVCGRNRLRSPTAEQIFSTNPGLAVHSAGLARDADNPVTPELLRWAELIFVMGLAHRKKLSAKLRAHLHAKPMICLNIPDDYEFMDPRLVELLKNRVGRFLPRI
jgi:predicted protein tyrosine phosphatase